MRTILAHVGTAACAAAAIKPGASLDLLALGVAALSSGDGGEAVTALSWERLEMARVFSA